MKVSGTITFSLLIALAGCANKTESEKIDSTVKGFMKAVHDSDFATFREYIELSIEHNLETVERAEFNFNKLHYAAKKYSNPNLDSVKYTTTSNPHRMGYQVSVIIPIFDGKGELDSCSGLKSMNVEMFFAPKAIGYDRVMGISIDDKYDANFRGYLIDNHLLCDDTKPISGLLNKGVDSK